MTATGLSSASTGRVSLWGSSSGLLHVCFYRETRILLSLIFLCFMGGLFMPTEWLVNYVYAETTVAV